MKINEGDNGPSSQENQNDLVGGGVVYNSEDKMKRKEGKGLREVQYMFPAYSEIVGSGFVL